MTVSKWLIGFGLFFCVLGLLVLGTGFSPANVQMWGSAIACFWGAYVCRED